MTQELSRRAIATLPFRKKTDLISHHAAMSPIVISVAAGGETNDTRANQYKDVSPPGQQPQTLTLRATIVPTDRKCIGEYNDRHRGTAKLIPLTEFGAQQKEKEQLR
jgi:hypothetical protein